MYVKLEENQDFSDVFDTWILGYCPDTNDWFATNQRYFYYEYDKEFESEEMAIKYFQDNTSEFIDIRQNIIKTTGGMSEDTPIYLYNTKETWGIESEMKG